MAGVVVAAALAAGPSATALFGSTAVVGGNAFTSAVLEPASGLEGVFSCPARGAGYTLTLAWTASPSGFVESYDVEWAPDPAGPWALLTNTTATTADDTGLPNRETRTYRVTARAQQWHSTPIEATFTSPNPRC